MDVLKRKIKWLMIIRLIIITIVLALGAIFGFLNQAPFYRLIIAVYIATIAYLLYFLKGRRLIALAYTQLIFDVVIETVMVHYSGGLESALVVLYILTIISASIVLSSKAANLIALVSSVMYSGLVALEYFKAVPQIPTGLDLYRGPLQVIYLVYVRITIFGLVGFLSGYLSKQLQREKDKSVRLLSFTDNILMNMGSGLITTKSDGTIDYANMAAAEILGYKANELKTRRIEDIFGENLHDMENSFHYEANARRQDGSAASVGFNISSLKDENQKEIGKIVIFRDLTQIKDMESRLRAKDRLSAVGRLAAGIAHEIRNPLAAISGSIELLKEDLDIKGDNKRLMDLILNETNRLNMIITDFLEYAGTKPLELKACDVNQVLDEVIMLLKNSNEFSDNIKIARKNENEKVKLVCDCGQMRQVFYNIVINAIQAMPSGGRLGIMAQNGGNDVILEFEDSGSGMDDAALEKLFEPFSSSKKGGHGIGLAIANRIVQNHNGAISVESKLGEGTKFIIRLPKKQ